MRVVDSHTEGEPTRVLVEGGPQLGGVTMEEKRDELQRDWDYMRTALTGEPRASEGTVAAILTEPVTQGATAGVIFANRSAYLGMCGHGTIGVARTLQHLGRIAGGAQRFSLDTPAGNVEVECFDDGSVQVRNVASYAYRLDVPLDVPQIGRITGDVAYGGNWFFLVDATKLELNLRIGLANSAELTALAKSIDGALRDQKITGENGAIIDHVELFSAPQRADADSKNFVLCPDGAYDRSPCGTGTSAKMAVLARRGELREGELWRQESITGTLFTGRYERCDHEIVPFIRGRAFITGETTLFFERDDPFRYGIATAERVR